MTIYIYDIYEGDKGIIIADSINRAIEIFRREYPDIEVTDDDAHWRNGNAFLCGIGNVENNKLFNAFPW